MSSVYKKQRNTRYHGGKINGSHQALINKQNCKRKRHQWENQPLKPQWPFKFTKKVSEINVFKKPRIELKLAPIKMWNKRNHSIQRSGGGKWRNNLESWLRKKEEAKYKKKQQA